MPKGSLLSSAPLVGAKRAPTPRYALKCVDHTKPAGASHSRESGACLIYIDTTTYSFHRLQLDTLPPEQAVDFLVRTM